MLEAAIRKLSGETVRVHCAGRTDAGVHALGQIVHFDTDWQIPVSALSRAMTGVLPPDLAIKDAGVAEPGFHSRFSATARVYRYVILNRQAPSALLGRYALHFRDPLDLDAMRAAASLLEGSHDFATFGKPAKPGECTVRRITQVRVRPFKDCVLITVRGNAFLRHMVRAFAGTLIDAGRGAITPADVERIRESRDRALCPTVAPPQGLCLVRVEYDGTRVRSAGTT